jgi:hypothetical protein
VTAVLRPEAVGFHLEPVSRQAVNNGTLSAAWSSVRSDGGSGRTSPRRSATDGISKAALDFGSLAPMAASNNEMQK